MKIKQVLVYWLGAVLLLFTITGFLFMVNVGLQEYRVYAADKDGQASVIKAENLKRIRICIAEAAEERAVHMAKARTETKRMISNSLSLYEGFKLWLFSDLFEEAFSVDNPNSKYVKSINDLDTDMDKVEENAKNLLNSMNVQSKSL